MTSPSATSTLKDRPLGLYYFGDDHEEEHRVFTETVSGSVTVNDVIFHVAQEGPSIRGIDRQSGMGVYHGHDGFLEFSHKNQFIVNPGRKF